MIHEIGEGLSFGPWLRARRRLADLTQKEPARQAGSAVVTIRKLESDRMRPSNDLDPEEIVDYRLAGDAARSALGDMKFAAIVTDGRRLSRTEAIEFATRQDGRANETI